MRFAGWYLKIAAGGAAIGAAMELFMIHTGFCASLTHSPPTSVAWYPTACANLDCLVPFILPFSLVHTKLTTPVLLYVLLPAADEKVTMLESEKRAWESSPEAQAMREALNPWHKNGEPERR
jgi:hypothetical protein